MLAEFDERTVVARYFSTVKAQNRRRTFCSRPTMTSTHTTSRGNVPPRRRRLHSGHRRSGIYRLAYVRRLLNAGYAVVVVDNLVNSHRESLRRVERITGQSLTFYQQDVCDEQALNAIFDAHPISAAIHFAALKAVGESTAKPL